MALCNLKDSIIHTLIAYVLIVSALLASINISIHLYMGYKDDMSHIDEQFCRIESMHIPSITAALWVFNEDLIKIQLNGMIQLKDIRHLQVIENERVVASLGTLQRESMTSKEFPLIHTNDNGSREIGKLLVVADLDGVHSRLFHRLFILLVSEGAKTLLIAGFMFMLFQFLVTRHLSTIASYVKSFNVDEPFVPLTLKRHRTSNRKEDELDQVVAAINTANCNLRQSHLKLNQELTAREQAEAVLQLYATQLERSNNDLQDFAFVASHDLQEPLRKIRAFGDRLRLKYRDCLDDTGRDYLERMSNAAGRMSTLIEALLTYSRVTTKARSFVRIDLSRLIQEVLEDLEIRIKETGGHVELGDLPTIDADSTQMHQLFQNLIGNALKFHREAKPVIRISSHQLTGDNHSSSETHRLILIEDNGIGFDEQYLDRIFKPFQRLHGRNEYEGTGMGLAICRKIVERHGWSITARSTPGKGSTFMITLPAKHSGGEAG